MKRNSRGLRREWLACLFSQEGAQSLARHSWREVIALEQGSEGKPEGASPLGLSGEDRTRLDALVGLARSYFPSGPRAAERLTGVSDIAARWMPVGRKHDERIIWVVTVDKDGIIEEEVLILMGGHPTKPPPLRSVLRSVLMRGRERVYVIDFRPFLAPCVDEATLLAFERLRELAGLAGLHLLDWVLVGYEGAASAAEAAYAKTGGLRAA